MTFIATNNHIDYLGLLMTVTLGEDWKTFFDIICANCNKPLWQSTEKPFYEVNFYYDTLKGLKVDKATDFRVDKTEKIMLEGNATLLTNYLQHKLDKEDLRIAFFGTHYLNDIRATYDFNHRLSAAGSPARWESIAVIREFENHIHQPYTFPGSVKRWG